MNPKHDVEAVSRQFEIGGKWLVAKPYGSGHINDTYCAEFEHGNGRPRYIFQRINHFVFKNPVALMENIQRVTEWLAKKPAKSEDSGRRALKLIRCRDGASHSRDPEGNYWRVYEFVEKARSHDAVSSPDQAFQAAKAFGNFQSLLSDLPAPRLHDTIPDFHHTPKRFATLEKAIEEDARNRAAGAKAEIEFAMERKAMASVLLDAHLPERVTHNDTKFNNVLLDDVTGEGICVIDLDTVMPGLALYDFGDMVRTTTSPSLEDERDLSKVRMEFPMFEALARGYSEAANFLTRPEREMLVFSGKLITFEIGMRFLTDHLAGDVYFKVHREGHNLDRCRTQFKLVESIESQEAAMERFVAAL